MQNASVDAENSAPNRRSGALRLGLWSKLDDVERVVIFGRGGAGKSVLARELGDATGLFIIELDKVFWNDWLEPLPIEAWSPREAALAEGPRWIMDGDLGPYDDVEPRLRRADTVVRSTCLFAWRAWRRDPERRDLWDWTVRWRRRSHPHLLRAVAEFAPDAEANVLRNPRSVRRWLGGLGN